MIEIIGAVLALGISFFVPGYLIVLLFFSDLKPFQKIAYAIAISIIIDIGIALYLGYNELQATKTGGLTFWNVLALQSWILGTLIALFGVKHFLLRKEKRRGKKQKSKQEKGKNKPKRRTKNKNKKRAKKRAAKEIEEKEKPAPQGEGKEISIISEEKIQKVEKEPSIDEPIENQTEEIEIERSEDEKEEKIENNQEPEKKKEEKKEVKQEESNTQEDEPVERNESKQEESVDHDSKPEENLPEK